MIRTDDVSKPYKTFLPDSERKPMNRWKASQLKSKWGDTKLHNELTNSAFMLLLTRLKRLYSGYKIEVYERDHRIDSKFNATTMHVFMTKQLYLEIECSYVEHRCQLLYSIGNCPGADQIKRWLKEYPFSIAKREHTPKGGISAYFDRVKAYQGDKHFYTL